jgi:hypothetical protein
MGLVVGSPEHGEFIEDVKRLIIHEQVLFRQHQVAGEFTDGTGDLYLKKCQES